MFGAKLFFGGLLMLAVAMVICGQEPGNRSPTPAKPIVRNEQGQILSGLFDRSLPGVVKVSIMEGSQAIGVFKANCRTNGGLKTKAVTAGRVTETASSGNRQTQNCGDGIQCIGICMTWEPRACGFDCGDRTYQWFYVDCTRAFVTDGYRTTTEGECDAIDGSGYCRCKEDGC